MCNPLFSVVICTHNRAGLLSRAIESVCSQSLDPSTYELIIVDNQSTDDTRRVINYYRARYINVKLIYEARRGLSHARNAGWNAALGDYVIYLDDDAIAAQEWLSTAHRIITTVGPAVFGGPYYAYYDSDKPPWFA